MMKPSCCFLGYHLRHRRSRHQGWRYHGRDAPRQVWSSSCGRLLPGALESRLKTKDQLAAQILVFCSLPLVSNLESTSRFWPSWSRNTWRLSARWPWWGTALAQVSVPPVSSSSPPPPKMPRTRLSPFPGNVRVLPDCYVADELVVSRAGRRVRVGNTDAEGRMVMADLLCEMKEKVQKRRKPLMLPWSS